MVQRVAGSHRSGRVLTSSYPHYPVPIYNFSKEERAALTELGSATERMVVERWVELTFDHTHPEWCLSGLPAKADPLPDVLLGLDTERADRVYHSVERLASYLLLHGASHNWQYSSAHNHLLMNRAGNDHDFRRRLRNLHPSAWLDPLSSKRVRVQWWSDTPLSGPVRLPWGNDFVPPFGDEPSEHEIVGRVQGRTGNRYLMLSAGAKGEEPLALAQAAAQVQRDDGVAADLARLASPGLMLQMEQSITVKGSSRMDSVRFPEMPRLNSSRIQRASREAIIAMRSAHQPRELKQLVTALRWLSLALARWNESPPMATTLIYVALDTAHNGCIYRHRGDKCGCEDSQPTALDRYVNTLPSRLQLEIVHYLGRERSNLRKAPQAVKERHRWLFEHLGPSDRQSPSRWAERLMTQMGGFEAYQPLLRFHLAQLMLLKKRRLNEIKTRCCSDIKELRDSRNELVHDTGPLLNTPRTSYLASLAMEMLLLRIEEVSGKYRPAPS